MSADRSYTEVIKSGVASALGTASGCVMVAGGVAVATVVIVPTGTIAGITTGASCAAINYRTKSPEDQFQTTTLAFDAVKNTGSAGFKAFNYVRPLLFATGYQIGSKSAELTMGLAAATLTGLQAGAQNLVKMGQYIYENSDEMSISKFVPRPSYYS